MCLVVLVMTYIGQYCARPAMDVMHGLLRFMYATHRLVGATLIGVILLVLILISRWFFSLPLYNKFVHKITCDAGHDIHWPVIAPYRAMDAMHGLLRFIYATHRPVSVTFVLFYNYNFVDLVMHVTELWVPCAVLTCVRITHLGRHVHTLVLFWSYTCTLIFVWNRLDILSYNNWWYPYMYNYVFFIWNAMCVMGWINTNNIHIFG